MSLISLYQQIEKQEWIDIPEGWLQGRTVFGGFVAGLLIEKAMLSLHGAEKNILSCNVVFVGPVRHGQAKLTSEILRQGKSVTSMEVRLWQDDAVQSVLLVSFGSRRDSSIRVEQTVTAPNYPDPEQLKTIPFAKFMPECYQHFDVSWAEGFYPMAGSEKPDFGGWARFAPQQHDARAMKYADLVMLMDIWPPGVLPMFKTVAPASSLTWHITFVQPLTHDLFDWFKYKVVTEHAKDGYSTEYAHVWDRNNQLMAILRQTVTVFV